MDELRTTDEEDIADMLRQVEDSLQIRFGRLDFQHVTTFGELCAVIEAAAGATDTGGCTSQQAYYQLRATLRTECCPSADTLTPSTSLEALLPRKGRRQKVARLEKALGCPLPILQPTSQLSTALWCSLLGSCISFWFVPRNIGVWLIVVVLLALYSAYRFGRELRLQTVRELVHLLTTRHYARMRRRAGTINRREVRTIVQQLFADGLGVPIEALHPTARFN